MTGEKERHHLVAHLLVRHPRARVLFVFGEQEHREQVAAIFIARAPLADDAVDDRVEPRARALEADDRRQRQRQLFQ